MMKYLLKIFMLIILICIGIFTISFSMDGKMNDGLSEQGKMLYGFLAKAERYLREKYGSPSGVGGGAKEDGIWLMIWLLIDMVMTYH